jgi:hypothetical protein
MSLIASVARLRESQDMIQLPAGNYLNLTCSYGHKSGVGAYRLAFGMWQSPCCRLLAQILMTTNVRAASQEWLGGL